MTDGAMKHRSPLHGSVSAVLELHARDPVCMRFFEEDMTGEEHDVR
jgi:hypothetical protein